MSRLRSAHVMCSRIMPRVSRMMMTPLSSSLSSSSAASSGDSAQPLRRRKRRGGGKDNDQLITGGQSFVPDDPSTTTILDGIGGAFTPKDSRGNLLDAQEYLALASLSPWVPCPDMVIKRVLEIADASSSDVHVDLGCGDGRFNFAAVGGSFNVGQSWGVDVDDNILQKCHERLGRRYVPSGFNNNDVNNISGGNDSEDVVAKKKMSSEADKLEFIQADLIKVIERQKQKYQQQLKKQSTNTSVVVEEETDWSKEDEITNKLTKSTVITMYFVNDALKQIQPYLESTLGGKHNVRVITVGYEMYGWEPTWVERVLGLTIFKYDMANVTSVPVGWKVDEEGGDEENDTLMMKTMGGTENNNNGIIQQHTALSSSLDAEYTDVDESPALASYLQRKREQDMDELNSGLRIHHDEALNDFAQSKSMRLSQDVVQHGSVNNNEIIEDWELEEGGWDFDETEDPEELMKEAQRVMAEARMGSRGKGMKAGLDVVDKKVGEGGGKKKKVEGSRAKVVWKRPD